MSENSSEPSLRVGVIGCGRIAQSHLSNLVDMNDVKVVGVCDGRRDRADRAARKVGAPAFADASLLLTEVELDAVYVLTPTPTHADLGCAVLESGRHLMLEKPLASSMEEADRLVATASASGRLAAVAHQWRYFAGVEQARHAIAGLPVAVVNGWWYWTWPLVDWIADRETGGGQMLDQGIHLVDLARYLVGDVEDISAKYTLAARRDQGFPNWDAQVLHGRFRSGALLNVAVSYALFPELTEQPTLDVVARGVLVRVTPAATEVQRPSKTEIFPEQSDAILALDRAFVAACRGGDRALVRSDVEDARASLAVVMAANESAALSDATSSAVRQQKGR